jgi:hypothetical protein
MKDRSNNDSANRSHSPASESAAITTKANSTSYQIDDRRAASVMQRKFRNLANGLASANIIQQKTNPPNFQSNTKPFTQESE